MARRIEPTVQYQDVADSAKTVAAIKLDVDENTQALIRKLDDKVRLAKAKLHRNEEVTAIFIS